MNTNIQSPYLLFGLAFSVSLGILLFPFQSIGETKVDLGQIQKSEQKPVKKSCTYSKEYITALEFLRAQKKFSLQEEAARKTAEKVALGCDGAAKRFATITSLLSHSGAPTHSAIKSGVEYSSKTDTEAETFRAIFMTAFLEGSLNLDLNTSYKMAHSLSGEFQGDIKRVRRDFEKMLEFCLARDELNLPRPDCGSFSARIAKKGEEFEGEKGGIADSFIALYRFLRKESGPNLTTADALRLTEQLMEGGRHATENFIHAFKYAVSPNGLGYTTHDAIAFAKKLTLSTS